MLKRCGKQIVVFLVLFTILMMPIAVRAETNDNIETDNVQIELTAPGGLLMEAETGTVIFEKDKDTKRSPASVTKVMTLILIFDALQDGKITMDELVTTSAHAKSMGGSQVYLEEGETQTVENMIKCIVIASGNDASVAMAEHISGTELEFVKAMNERAAGLGMKNTHFVDCCGLTESEEHYTTPYDIALMSRELINQYPEILNYSSVWMDTITHVTKQGSKEFGLTNTNRMIRTYDGCVGLKTGSTSLAKFCLSAVAKRDGITLIAVVMAAPDYKVRIKDASEMLNYGFAKCSFYADENPPELPFVKIKHGMKDKVCLSYEKQFQYLSLDGQPISDIKKELKIEQETDAPIKKGEKAGELIYYMNGEELGRMNVFFEEDVNRITFSHSIKEIWKKICM